MIETIYEIIYIAAAIVATIIFFLVALYAVASVMREDRG